MLSIFHSLSNYSSKFAYFTKLLCVFSLLFFILTSQFHVLRQVCYQKILNLFQSGTESIPQLSVIWRILEEQTLRIQHVVVIRNFCKASNAVYGIEVKLSCLSVLFSSLVVGHHTETAACSGKQHLSLNSDIGRASYDSIQSRS